MESVRTPFEVEIRLAVPRPVRRHDRNDVCHRNTLGKPDRTANSGKNSYLYPPGLPRNTKYNIYRMMKPHKILWLGCCLAVAGCGGDKSSARNYDKEIDQLMDRMTLAEKIGQMNQVSGKSNPTGVLKQYSSIEGRVREGKIGTVLNVTGAATTRELQRIAVEETRLGIPLIFALDVIHGYKTISPVPLAESCSWDMETIEASARMAAVEASAAGLQWTFAPMVDIARDPRWGRVMEGAGEDPYLGSHIARARVRGFQGDDLSAPNTILACAKHFAGYGASEGGRDYNTVDISDQRLRELYLPPFKAAADAGAATFMNSFNELSGVPATGNRFLVKQILRNEWGWDGVIVSDWGSVAEMIPHGIAEDKKQAALLAVKNECDIDMEGNCYPSSLEELVKEGKVSEKEIDRSVRRILRLKYELGLFDNPYRYCDEQREKEVTLSAAHREAARDMARKSIVLLENRKSVLPLGKPRSIAVVGPLADSPVDMLGEWRAKGDPKEVVTILRGIEKTAGAGTRVTHAKGCDVTGSDRSGFAEAVRAARSADVVIACLGESADMSGEGYCRSELGLPGVQQELLKELKKTGKPIVLLLSNGRPLTLAWEKENIETIVETWFLGTEAGNAVADVLFGKYNPSGKLVMSFPYNVGQIPVYYNHKHTGRPFEPNQRYVMHYIDAPVDALYPFGYGLSYTRFEYGEPTLSSDRMAAGDTITATVKVTNAGDYDGEEVVQLYIRDLKAQITRPVKELKGFRKIFLKKGESADVTFDITRAELEYVLADGSVVSDPGEFELFIGGSSAGLQPVRFSAL